MIQLATFKIKFKSNEDFSVITSATLQTMLECEYPEFEVDVELKDLGICVDDTRFEELEESQGCQRSD